MAQRNFSDANNPAFHSDPDVILLPFGRTSYLKAIVGARLGIAVGALLFCSDNVTLAATDDRGYRGLKKAEVKAGFEAGLDIVLSMLSAL